MQQSQSSNGSDVLAEEKEKPYCYQMQYLITRAVGLQRNHADVEVLYRFYLRSNIDHPPSGIMESNGS